MKDSLLLIMTPNVSLEVWNKKGQLQREWNFYNKLCASTGLKLIIFSYGRNDRQFTEPDKSITILQMPSWIPAKLPYRVQNVIYHFTSLIYFHKYFKLVKIAKTNQFRSASFGMLFKLIYGVPLVLRMGFYYSHIHPVNIFERWKEYIRFKYSDTIIVTSSEAADFIASTYNINVNKITPMRNSVDLNIFRPGDLTKFYDVIFLGRLEKQKNVELFINSVIDTDLNVLIIGNGSLKYLVDKALSENENITWISKVNNNDLPHLFNSARIYVLVSNSEGSPKSLLEAMACGLPCIGTRVAGTRECINDEKSGLFVDMDPAQIRSKIYDLLSDTSKAEMLGRNALEWVNLECNMDNNIKKETSIYKALLG